MSAQPAFEVHFPVDRPLTWEDLQTIPDDRYHHYEIVDGALVVSPSPGGSHQACAFAVARLLHAAAPADLRVLPAPFDFAPLPGVSLQPDVLVARRADIGERRIERPPLLVVEVVSASSRVTDRTVKRALYEEFGVSHYWIVDPAQPSVTLLRLDQGRYVEEAEFVGDEAYAVREPFPVTLVPSALVDA